MTRELFEFLLNFVFLVLELVLQLLEGREFGEKFFFLCFHSLTKPNCFVFLVCGDQAVTADSFWQAVSVQKYFNSSLGCSGHFTTRGVVGRCFKRSTLSLKLCALPSAGFLQGVLQTRQMIFFWFVACERSTLMNPSQIVS